MSKADWGKPGYQGRPDPISVANKIMFIFILLLFLGFIKAGINNGWFDGIVRFILS